MGVPSERCVPSVWSLTPGSPEAVSSTLPTPPRGFYLQASRLCASPSTSVLPLNFLLLSPDNPRILFIPFPSISFPYPAPPALHTPREVFQIWGQGTPGWEFTGPGWGVPGPAPPSSARQLVDAPAGLTERSPVCPRLELKRRRPWTRLGT